MRAFRSFLCEDWVEPTLRCSGIVGGPIEQVTVDGYDMTWGTNALGKRFPILDEMASILNTFSN